jgi:CrcB protein
MSRLLWIGLGGFIGTCARYLLSGWALRVLGSGFAYGTLAVNLIGSFLLGILMYAGQETTLLPPALRLTLTTGFCGGFTTYSTFNYETLRYFQDGAWLIGGLNIAVTLVACLLAGLAGWLGTAAVLGG